MKKLLVGLFIVVSSMSFAISEITSESIEENGKNIGDVYIAKFDSTKEKDTKILREKKYMMSKDDFKVFTDKDGIMYMASYDTPFGYTVSFKAFCGNKYISVNGSYANFDELKEYFLNQTKKYGYEF